MHVGAIQSPGSAVVGSGVVVGLFDFGEVFQLAELCQTVVDELPGAIEGFGVNFAFAVNGTATWAVQETLGTAGDGADAAELAELAVTAGQAGFEPFSLLLDQADEKGVDAGIDALIREDAGEELYAGPAGEAENGVGIFDFASDVLEELLVALSLDGGLSDVGVGALEAEEVGQGGYLLFSAGKADGDAGATAENQQVIDAGKHLLDLFERFLFGSNHCLVPLVMVEPSMKVFLYSHVEKSKCKNQISKLQIKIQNEQKRRKTRVFSFSYVLLHFTF